MTAGQRLEYTNKKNVKKIFVAVHDTPKHEDDKCMVMKIEYAGDPLPRKQYTRHFKKDRMVWL